MLRLMNFPPKKFAVQNVDSNSEYSKLQKVARNTHLKFFEKPSSRALGSYVAAVDHFMVKIFFHACF